MPTGIEKATGEAVATINKTNSRIRMGIITFLLDCARASRNAGLRKMMQNTFLFMIFV